MQMSEAAVLTEVEGIREANEKLAEGWRLLAVTVKTSPANNEQYTHFVLGKPAQPTGNAGVFLSKQVRERLDGK
jgi:hypothetical protein